jgi:dolichol-phosphate mannosyltransferase
MPGVLAVIPAYNEASRIGPVIAAMRAHGLPVLVVDDGSRDATRAAAEAMGAHVVGQANAGKGAALIAGCAYAVDHGYERVVLLDGDGQHDPADAPRLLAAARGADLVIGKRTRRIDRQPLYRRAFNRLSSLLVTLMAGHRVIDSQSGFRVLDPRLLLALPLRGRRYDLETEVCILAARAGRRIREVPINVIYTDKRSGVHPVFDTARFFWACARAMANSRSRVPVEKRTASRRTAAADRPGSPPLPAAGPLVSAVAS